jgi:plasmid maintenance system antidote protein VapI
MPKPLEVETTTDIAMTGITTMARAKGRTITETLKSMIAASGESVNAIARGAGIPQPVLWRFVHDQRDLTLRTAEKLIAYFGLELRLHEGPSN